MEEEEVKTLDKKTEKKILKAVKKAISLAEEDVGLDEKHYGFLECRIEWYMNHFKYELGYLVETRFNTETYTVEITEVYDLSEEIKELERMGIDVLRNPYGWRVPEM